MNQLHQHILIAICSSLLAINLSIGQNQEIELWSNGVPNSIETSTYIEHHDTEKDRITKVSNPTLTVSVPDKPNGTSVIICPGGGYAYLAIDKVGYKAAEWFNTLGITTFILKYRLPSDEIMENKSIGPLQDAQEAIRYVRRNTKKWNLDPQKIGVIGFSAGGHLAASLSTMYNEIVYESTDKTSAKPDFSMLIYPVISMKDEITHRGSRNLLIGKTPPDELVEKFSTELSVDEHTPPTFLVHALDDKAVVPENSMLYFLALKKHQVITEMHLYQSGGHGFGLGRKGSSQIWTHTAENWMKENQIIK
jgi:acetyl esterase/lipase